MAVRRTIGRGEILTTEQEHADTSDLAYVRMAKEALHRMSIGDMETAPPEIIEMYKRCCRETGALRSYFEGCVNAHSDSGES